MTDTIGQVCDALSAATGWDFRFEPVGRGGDAVRPGVTLPQPLPDREGSKSKTAGDPWLEWSAPVNLGVGASLGHLKMDRPAVGVQALACADDSSLKAGLQPWCAPHAAAQQLATLFVEMLGQREQLRSALTQREAQLAAAAPIAIYPRPATDLAKRLDAVLRGGAQSLRCQAAAMYLLDDATTELKLRAQWGLGAQSLAEPARPLAGALADLEALCGHAVVLEDEILMDLWRVPEPCGAAVCVPISGPSTVLGTLWLMSAKPRKFSPTETNLAEIIAGRLAAELEREALIGELQQRGRGGRS